MIAHVVAPPLTASNDPSRSPQSSEVTQQVEAVLRATYSELPNTAWCLQHRDAKGPNSDTKPGHILPVAFTGDGVICLAHGQGGAEVRLDGAPSLTCNHEAPIVFDTTQLTHPANRSAPKPGDPCHPLAAGAHAPAVAFDARQSDVCVYGEKTGPLDTDGHTIGVCVTGDRTHTLAKSSGATEDGTGRGTPIVPTRTMAVRRLTPVECERLQGFPDGHTAIPYRGKPASDGPRYKALGNSMAVPVMRWIGERIAKVEQA